MSVIQNITYDWKPREWQQKCIDTQKRFTVLAVHRRAGKTTFAINELVLSAITKKGNYVYICPVYKQAKMVAWQPLKEAVAIFKDVVDKCGKSAEIVEIRESETKINFWNGSTIFLLGSDNFDAVRGLKLAGVVLDEVAQMPKGLWNEGIRPALSDSKGWGLFIGTPKGINLFSELFYRGLDPEFSDNWTSSRFTYLETNAIDPDEMEAIKKETPEEVFKREYLCDFNASAIDQLISYELVKLASEREINFNSIKHNPLIMGVDVARFGNDRSVICFRQGLLIEEPLVYKDLSLVEFARVVRQQAVSRHCHEIYVDGTGVGGGVVDILNSQGIYVNDVNFGKKSLDHQYKNKRTEMWCRLADWINRGGCIPKNTDLITEIATPYFDVTDDNQKILETKKQIRDRLGKSPDMADALALTFAEDIPVCDLTEYEKEKLFYRSARKQRVSNNPFEEFENEICSRENTFNTFI